MREGAPKFVFVSNYINHHQIPFCNAMYRELKGDFAFLQTEPMEQERIRMGWDSGERPPYLALWYEDRELCESWIDQCRILLFGGSEREELIEERLRAGKPVVRYSERLYKTGQWKAVSPRGILKKYRDHIRYRRAPVYMLCAGAYVPSDFHLIRAYPDKLLRWGYFPETRTYDIGKLMERKTPGSILWAARFLDWKHPELVLECARWLKERGIPFHIDLIGGGGPEQQVRVLAGEYGVEDVVTFQGYKTPGQVRAFMEKAQIYLMTSDRQEGWGAVVNEAMNSGCALVASHMAGAVPFLIQNEENGLVYLDGKKETLFVQTARLLEDASLRERLGRAAYETVTGCWNAERAAGALLGLCVGQGFLEREDLLSEPAEMFPREGPCSKAPVVSERAMGRLYMPQMPRGSGG